MNHVMILAALITLSGAIRLAEADACNPNLCKNGATCQLSTQGYNWGFLCVCQPGYIGSQCQWDGNRCDANTKTPCKNGGRCFVLPDDGRFCDCPGQTDTSIKYGGHYCEIENPCLSCPSKTVYCRSAATAALGRLCLDASRIQIA